MPHRITLLLLVAALAQGWAQMRAVLTGSRVRVEATAAAGGLRERFLAKEGPGWVELASSGGEILGPLSIENHTSAAPRVAVTGLSADRTTLVQQLSIGDLRIRRTLSLTARESWVKATTRLEAGFPTTLHAFSDKLRAAIEPDWSYAPSVGGFIPDAQYKAPLILVQSGRRAVGIVPDVMGLMRDVLEWCNHALDLDVPAGPVLSVGFIPARLAYHSVYREDPDRVLKVSRPVEHSYYIYVSAEAAPQGAYREAVRFHWDQFARRQMEEAATTQAGTDPLYKQCGLWDDWRHVIWDEESRQNWLSFVLPDGSTGGAVKMLRWGAPSPSVYLGAWFNSLRTAYGMALYARRTDKPDLLKLATQTLQIALQAPGMDGAFQCIAVPRSARGPVAWAAGDGSGSSTVRGFLGFDMSWTAYWMLRWRAEGLPGAGGIVDRCRRLADFLISRQQPDGMLPTRFNEGGFVEPGAARMVQAETAPVALFLLELFKTSPKNEYLEAARKGLAFLDREVIPGRKWYDFETFWSCSPRLIGWDERTRQWPANNLALIHATAAYLAAFEVTHQREYLDKGQARRPSFPRRYSDADIASLAEVDAAHEDLSGPAVRHLCQRAWAVFGEEKFQRLAGISASHIYNLRRSRAYRKIRVRVEHTQGSQVSIGERRRPEPKGKPGYLRVDTVHQGQHDGQAGVYHLNAVDTVTQWEVVGCTETISERHLIPVLEAMLHQYPFRIVGFIATTGRSFSTTRWSIC